MRVLTEKEKEIVNVVGTSLLQRLQREKRHLAASSWLGAALILLFAYVLLGENFDVRVWIAAFLARATIEIVLLQLDRRKGRA